MAIKFRCTHCRGLLGIGQNQAGGVVDCPRCGRSVRVPALDGRVEPIDDPTLDLGDSGLARALDELAGLEERPEGFDPAAAELTGESPPTVQPRVAVALPVPESSEPQQPAEVLARPADPPPSGHAVLEELAPRSAPLAAAPLRRGWSVREWTVVVVCLLLGAGAGVVLQRTLSPGVEPVAVPAVKPDDKGSKGSGLEMNRPASVDGAIALRGRVTYRSDSGASLPDQGAHVIVFPLQRRGQVKLSAVGFRTGDDHEDFLVARAGWRALGGDLAIVGDEGRFEVVLPESGKYRLLVLSRYQGRPAEQAVGRDLVPWLTTWFDRPRELLGQLKYRVDTVRFDGRTAVNWEYSFAAD